MTALLLLAAVPVVMWLGQTVMLRRHGLPIRLRLDPRNAPRAIRTTGRVITQLSLFAVLLAYPLVRGLSPVEYYGALLPRTRAVLQAVQGAAAATLFLSVLFLFWMATDRVTIEAHQSRRRLLQRLLLLIPTAILGATIEELLFRGVVMADAQRWFPDLPYIAVGWSTLVFAGAHYVRTVKRRWTFPGHLMLGLLFSLAFLQTGSLWLPIGLHAAGILMIMGTRPFFVYRGPAWLTGASIFPFAGIFGIAGLGLLTAFVVTYYGAP